MFTMTYSSIFDCFHIPRERLEHLDIPNPPALRPTDQQTNQPNKQPTSRTQSLSRFVQSFAGLEGIENLEFGHNIHRGINCFPKQKQSKANNLYQGNRSLADVRCPIWQLFRFCGSYLVRLLCSDMFGGFWQMISYPKLHPSSPNLTHSSQQNCNLPQS